MLIESAALATAAIEGGTAIEGVVVAEGVVEGAAIAEGAANVVKLSGKISDFIEKVEVVEEFPNHLEETTKILEPDMGEIQEVTLDAIEQANMEKAAAKIDETSQNLRELTED